MLNSLPLVFTILIIIKYLNVKYFCECSPIIDAINNTKLQDEWYLSSDGRDSAKCGKTIITACKTLDWLLGRFFTHKVVPPKTLFLTTDTSLHINSKLVVKHPWIRITSVVLHSMDAKYSNNITVEFTKVTLLSSSWNIYGLNFIGNMAYLPSTTLIFNKLKRKYDKRIINIKNSVFGHLNVSGGYDIRIRDCNIDGTTRSAVNLIYSFSNTLSIFNCTFYNFTMQTKENFAIIVATASDIRIENAIFTGNNLQQGLIQVQHGSQLFVNDSTFRNNGEESILGPHNYVITIAFLTSATINRCVFINNHATSLFTNFNTTVHVENSQFIENADDYDGNTIFCENHVNISSLNNSFTSNAAASYIHAKQNVRIIIENNKFSDSQIASTFIMAFDLCSLDVKLSIFSHAEICFDVRDFTNVSIVDSVFTGNSYIVSGYSNVRTIFRKCTFLENRGVVTVIDKAFVSVEDSSIANCSDAVYYVSNEISGKSDLILRNTNITNCVSKDAYSGSTVLMSNCLFERNYLSFKMSNTQLHLENTELIYNKNALPSFVSAADQSQIYLHNMSITGNELVECCSFIDLDDSESEIFIENAIINDNKVNGNGTFISARSNNQIHVKNAIIKDNNFTYIFFIISTWGTQLRIFNCIFSNNIFSSLLQASGMSNTTVYECQIVNTSSMQKNHLFKITRGTIHLHECYLNNFTFGVLNLSESYAKVESTIVTNTGDHYIKDGLVIHADNSNISLTNCTFSNNNAQIMKSIGPDFPNSIYLQMSQCTINDSGGIAIENIADVNIQSSSFQDGYLTIITVTNTIIANTEFNSYPLEIDPLQTKQFSTYNSSFAGSDGSAKYSDDNFLPKAIRIGYISVNGPIQQEKTPYAADNPSEREIKESLCNYYHNRETGVNIYNCSSSDMKRFPTSAPNNTDWLLMRNTKITELCDSFTYFCEITFLDLRQSNVSFICDSFVSMLYQNENIKWLSLAENNLVNFPIQTESFNYLEKMWLGGNPFYCDCEMLWMVKWLNTFTTGSGQHVIVDYKELICHSGMMIGTPIYKLSEVEMGCFPSRWTISQEIDVGVAAGLSGLLILGLTLLTIKRSRDIKFFLYYCYKCCVCFGVSIDDKNEQLDTMEYDAYLSYSNKDTRWVSQVFRRNKWKDGSKLFDLEKDDGFRLLVPQRDFLPGAQTRHSIGEEMERSRKIIFVVSRNFLRSKQKMWYFKLADADALKKKKIIMVFKEKMKLSELTPELQNYWKLNLIIQAKENINILIARIRFNMPHTPLEQLKPNNFPKIGDEENAFDSYDEETDEADNFIDEENADVQTESPEDDRVDISQED